MSVLELNGVWKLYGEVPALKDASFCVEAGEIVGLLGLNGAGKSTMMKLITGLVPISKGTISVDGIDVTKNHAEAARRIGAMIEAPAFHPELTGWQNIQLAGFLRPGVTKREMLDAIETVGLEDRFGYVVKKYSIGMKQRLHFAQSILGSPRLLLLDEPLSGIDPVATKRIRDTILEIAKRGSAVVVSSHVLAEIEHFCTRIVIIDKGEIVLDRPREGIDNLETVFLECVSKGGKAQ